MTAAPPFRALGLLPPVKRVLQGVLLLQIGVAGLLLAADLEGDGLLADPRPIAPAETRPIAPGDQARRFTPRTVPVRPGPMPAAPIPLPREMGSLDFEVLEVPEHGTVMLLSGSIGSGDSDRFERALDAAEADAPIAAVALHSPGGRLVEALRIGEIVRQRGLDTLMTAEAACMSACPIILFAGVERIVSRHAWVGLHQAFVDEGTVLPTRLALIDVQALQGEVIDYTARMGVDPAVHVHTLTTPPEDVYFLVEQELVDYRVATEIVD